MARYIALAAAWAAVAVAQGPADNLSLLQSSAVSNSKDVLDQGGELPPVTPAQISAQQRQMNLDVKKQTQASERAERNLKKMDEKKKKTAEKAMATAAKREQRLKELAKNKEAKAPRKSKQRR
mmetsp:Transcript_78265/g.176863  ORF Transcript_78265/g.176863 Transcript_78265/m.176863 type:complete len:123 (-) Transcript_78265:111-479(-)|eukprot:CAMPEP_0197902164 /NCGR_PEP_ID=MMETSP1439-20131203/52740_1 /TAXON_ID=66791 /ORGANISM="Gonyaulax spinifera, Strain CCMP409" /LENGTH=122 /DNA_ID=CAMNT_0043523169 /DNA_START=66 /DNA_END=434 /DNA_ORIENTATION=+